MCLSVCLCEWRGFRFSVYLMICSSCSRQSVATLVILLFCFSGNTFIPFQDLLSLNYDHIEHLFYFPLWFKPRCITGVRKPLLPLKRSGSRHALDQEVFGGEVLVWSGPLLWHRSYVTSGLAATAWLGLETTVSPWGGVDSDAAAHHTAALYVIVTRPVGQCLCWTVDIIGFFDGPLGPF